MANQLNGLHCTCKYYTHAPPTAHAAWPQSPVVRQSLPQSDCQSKPPESCRRRQSASPPRVADYQSTPVAPRFQPIEAADTDSATPPTATSKPANWVFVQSRPPLPISAAAPRRKGSRLGRSLLQGVAVSAAVAAATQLVRGSTQVSGCPAARGGKEKKGRRPDNLLDGGPARSSTGP
jgi:hypothetical protein